MLAYKQAISKNLEQYLKEINVTYILLRTDHYQLQEPEYKLIVLEDNLRKIAVYIKQFCTQNNIIIIPRLKYEKTNPLYLLYYYDIERKCFSNLKIRIIYGHQSSEKLLLSAKELLSNRAFDKREWRLNDTYAFIYQFIQSVDHNKTNLPFLQLLNYWQKSHVEIIDKLKRFFEENSIAYIKRAFFNNDPEYLKANLGYIKNGLKSKVAGHKNYNIFKLFRILQTVFSPPGLVIGILGRDGCGKSTFVSEITSALEANFENTNAFKKFPSFFYKKQIFRKKEVFETQKPHYYKKRNRISSFIKLNFLLTEFIFGYWFKIYPLKVKSHLILFDRYFIDILADPLRYRIKTSKIFIKAFHYLIPKPDIWIILDLPSNILLKRKQELSYEMAEKLRYEYLKLQRFLPNSVVINNDEEINKTITKASAFILNFMHKKTA